MMMKRLFLLLLPLLASVPAAAQLYVPGEELNYRVSYKAKLIPNTEVATVTVRTSEAELDGRPCYNVYGNGRTLVSFRWFFSLDDTYNIWVDPATLRTLRFESDLHEGSYTFRSRYDYDWDSLRVETVWRSRERPEQRKRMSLTPVSMDAVSLFFNMRTAEADRFREGEQHELQMVLEDTVRHLKYRLVGREERKIRNLGRFRTLKFACQIGTSESYSFTDGSEFYIWLSDDRNKIPLYLESPIRVGSVCAYITSYKGLKYPLDSFIR